MTSSAIVYLIGFAGVGKLTIAKELEKIGDFKIVDNHLINNPVFSFIDLQNGVPKLAWDNVDKIRDIVFETISKLSLNSMNFIFTNELFEGSEDDLKIYKRVEKLAVDTRRKFYPVRLLISPNEHKNRIVHEGRKECLKISDKEYVDKINDMEVLKITNKNLIEIDITTMSAREVAEYIMSNIKEKQCQ